MSSAGEAAGLVPPPSSPPPPPPPPPPPASRFAMSANGSSSSTGAGGGAGAGAAGAGAGAGAGMAGGTPAALGLVAFAAAAFAFFANPSPNLRPPKGSSQHAAVCVWRAGAVAGGDRTHRAFFPGEDSDDGDGTFFAGMEGGEAFFVSFVSFAGPVPVGFVAGIDGGWARGSAAAAAAAAAVGSSSDVSAAPSVCSSSEVSVASDTTAWHTTRGD